MLSGGPDSAAAAKLLWQKGFDLQFIHLIPDKPDVEFLPESYAAASIAHYFNRPLYYATSDFYRVIDSKDYWEPFVRSIFSFVKPNDRFVVFVRCAEDDSFDGQQIDDETWNLDVRRIQQYIPGVEQVHFSDKQQVKDTCGDYLWNITWSCAFPRLTSRGIEACNQCFKCISRNRVSSC